jgi:hypothetical protein
MAKLVDFNELKANKDGILTPKALISNVMDQIDEATEVVVIIRKKDEQVIYGMSEMNMSKAVGLCELGKMLIINDMWEEM